MIQLVDATPDLIIKLKDNLREADRREITNFGVSPAKGVWRSFKGGLMNTIALVDGEVAAGWGVSGVLLSGTAAPWLLTTPVCLKVSPLTFARIYKDQVQRFHEVFHRLENYVDSSYTQAIKMLRIAGFEVDPPEQIGKGVFCRFHKEI